MNAILGFSVNLPLEDVTVFVTSAREVMPKESTRIVLWIDGAETSKLLNLSEHFDVELHHIQTPYGPKPNSLTGKIRWNLAALATYSLRRVLTFKPQKRRQTAMRWMIPVASRHLYFLDYLKHHPEIRNVFLTDVRDVVFQRNVFRQLACDKLCIAQEHGSIGENPKAMRWCRTFLSSKESKRLRGRRLHCAGTILGTRDRCIEFLEMYEAKILQLKHVFWGADMAVFLHVVFHLNSEKIYSMSNSRDCIVYTGSQKIDAAFPKHNSRGEIFAVVHMYDRNKALKDKIQRRFLASKHDTSETIT